MDCETCDALLEDYRRAVDTFKAAVERSGEAVQDDRCLGTIEAADLADKCKEAADRLMEHWRAAHQGLAANAGS